MPLASMVRTLLTSTPAEPALELVGHLAHDVYVYLMVQKTIDLEDIALFDDSRCEDLFF